MAQKPATGRVQKNLRIKVGTDNYEKQVNNVNWPGKTGLRWRGGTPDAVVMDTAAIDETCNITLIEAPGDPESFWSFCFDHDGEEAEVEYLYDADDEVKFTATIMILRPQLGGPVNQFNEVTIAFPSTPPVKVPVAP
jgi:hypothetical protein